MHWFQQGTITYQFYKKVSSLLSSGFAAELKVPVNATERLSSVRGTRERGPRAVPRTTADSRPRPTPRARTHCTPCVHPCARVVVPPNAPPVATGQRGYCSLPRRRSRSRGRSGGLGTPAEPRGGSRRGLRVPCAGACGAGVPWRIREGCLVRNGALIASQGKSYTTTNPVAVQPRKSRLVVTDAITRVSSSCSDVIEWRNAYAPS